VLTLEIFVFDAGEYLRHLVHDKEETEYIAWLEKVQKFVA